MAKHRAGDRRIVSISIPEDLAIKLDRRVGKGRSKGRSATISRLIEQSLQGNSSPPVSVPASPLNGGITEDTRKEIDSLGEVDVPKNAYYGAQTARSLVNFDIGSDIMPRSMIRAFGLLKQAAARANVELGDLDEEIGNLSGMCLDSCSYETELSANYYYLLLRLDNNG